MWVVCWRIGGVPGAGHELRTRAAAQAWAKYGNSIHGGGSHWTLEIIPGGRATIHSPLSITSPREDTDEQPDQVKGQAGLPQGS